MISVEHKCFNVVDLLGRKALITNKHIGSTGSGLDEQEDVDLWNCLFQNRCLAVVDLVYTGYHCTFEK